MGDAVRLRPCLLHLRCGEQAVDTFDRRLTQRLGDRAGEHRQRVGQAILELPEDIDVREEFVHQIGGQAPRTAGSSTGPGRSLRPSCRCRAPDGSTTRSSTRRWRPPTRARSSTTPTSPGAEPGRRDFSAFVDAATASIGASGGGRRRARVVDRHGVRSGQQLGFCRGEFRFGENSGRLQIGQLGEFRHQVRGRSRGCSDRSGCRRGRRRRLACCACIAFICACISAICCCESNAACCAASCVYSSCAFLADGRGPNRRPLSRFRRPLPCGPSCRPVLGVLYVASCRCSSFSSLCVSLCGDRECAVCGQSDSSASSASSSSTTSPPRRMFAPRTPPDRTTASRKGFGPGVFEHQDRLGVPRASRAAHSSTSSSEISASSWSTTPASFDASSLMPSSSNSTKVTSPFSVLLARADRR